jgi:hypothetical protein
MRKCLVRKLLVPAAFVLLAAGCSGASVSTVKGQVFYNGEPLAGGDLEFRPEKDLTLGSFGGGTDSEGRFEIKIGKGTGMNAKPGRFVVLITKGKAIGISPPDAHLSEEERVKALMQMGPGAPGVGGKGATGILPERYSNAATTPFKVEISDGANDLEPFRMEGPPLKKKS